jgi:hypothetical protein
MIRYMMTLFIILVSMVAVNAYARDSREAARIEHLIASVEALEGATFIRNGKAYDARSASNHLRLKLKNAGDRVKTAEDFITFCGSNSSMTGVPYRIKLADGTIVKAEVFFRKKLVTFGQER